MGKTHPFNLHDRAMLFARDVRILLHKIPRTIALIEDGKQLIRSSGSVGANYLEANECLGYKDQLYRFKISRKEAKESSYWLNLLMTGQDTVLETERLRLLQESTELIKIMSTIINKIGPNV
jgi:four helix bundle protein